MTAPTKTRVAVLGGGAGALAAAFALSDSPERRARFEVTVHQLGFRLGGKAAGGRNLDAGARVEEVGPHVLLGCYEHTFRLARACYMELDRPAGSPLASWESAFSKQSHAVVFCKLADYTAHEDGWFPWVLRFPTNDLAPGDGGEVASLFGLFQLGIEWLWSLFTTSEEAATLRSRVPHEAFPAAEGEVPAWIAAAIAKVEASAAFEPLGPSPLLGAGIARHDAPDVRFEPGLGRLISWARNVVRALPADPAAHDAASQHVLLWLFRRIREAAWALLKEHVPSEIWAYKLWVSVDLAASMGAGFLSDGILFHGWGAVDHLDLRDWLKAHGAGEVTLESGLVSAMYEVVHAFVNGDVAKGNLAAGTAMNALLRMMLTYKGAAIWHMNAGAADTLFAPLYEVLRKRGVQFRFFHRLAAMRLSDDRRTVQSLEFVEQVQLKGQVYDPLVEVKGLRCWPNAPRYEQIEQGEELRASGVDLESPYSAPWQDARPLTLHHGIDYDAVVLGVALGAIPYVASELILAHRGFSALVANVGTVQSFSFQLWCQRDLAEMGWALPEGVSSGPVSAGYLPPVSSWCDRSHLVAHEDWALPAPPRNVAAFSGVLEQLGPAALFIDSGFPARQRARVQSMARKHLENEIGRIWPLATKLKGHGFHWDMVVSQVYRANVDPSDRQVLSVAGSAQHRPLPGQSGFENLVLAGDWTRTSLNLGCIEAAVESGLAAAEALIGE